MRQTFSTSAAASSLVFGLLCAPVGLAIGAFVAATATGSGYDSFLVVAPLAAFATAAVLWRLVIGHPHRLLERPRWASAVSGALAGALSHWVCWYLLLVWSNVTYWLLGSPASSSGEPPVGPVTALAAALVLSAWSLAFFGALTVPAGAALGLIWRYWLVRREHACSGS